MWRDVVPQPALAFLGLGDVVRIALVGRLLVLAEPGHGRQISRLDSWPMIAVASGISVAIPSRTAARDRARLTTRVLPETPARPRDNPASVAPADSPDARSASEMPRISRSRISRVASGATSR